jgi:predicted RNase H-like nuclease (RuvC/YqgF family)
MDSSQILVIVGFLIAAIPGILAFVVNQRTAKTADKKVDAEAYERAQRIYTETLKDVEAQLRRLRQENAELIAANQRLQRQLNEIETLVVKMRRTMMELGVQPPQLEGNTNGN